jgi:hypothetical protein
MAARTTDKKRYKKMGRIIQAILRDTIHGANDPTTVTYRRLQELDAVLDAIRVPGEEPEEERPDAIDGE